MVSSLILRNFYVNINKLIINNKLYIYKKNEKNKILMNNRHL